MQDAGSHLEFPRGNRMDVITLHILGLTLKELIFIQDTFKKNSRLTPLNWLLLAGARKFNTQ